MCGDSYMGYDVTRVPAFLLETRNRERLRGAGRTLGVIRRTAGGIREYFGGRPAGSALGAHRLF